MLFMPGLPGATNAAVEENHCLAHVKEKIVPRLRRECLFALMVALDNPPALPFDAAVVRNSPDIQIVVRESSKPSRSSESSRRVTWEKEA